MGLINELLDKLAAITDTSSDEYKNTRNKLAKALYDYCLYCKLRTVKYCSFGNVTGFYPEEAANIMAYKVICYTPALLDLDHNTRITYMSKMFLSAFFDYLRPLKRVNERFVSIPSEWTDYVGMHKDTVLIVEKNNEDNEYKDALAVVPDNCHHDDDYTEESKEASAKEYKDSYIEENYVKETCTATTKEYIKNLLSNPISKGSLNGYTSMTLLWLGEYKPSKLAHIIFDNNTSVLKLMEGIFNKYSLSLLDVFDRATLIKLNNDFTNIVDNPQLISKYASNYLNAIKKKPLIYCSDITATYEALQIKPVPKIR